MKYLNKSSAKYVIGVLILTVIFIIKFIFKLELELKVSSLKDIWKLYSITISTLVVICIFFSHKAWKWRIWKKWFVLIPNLNGTWKGELHSSWIDSKTGKRVGPIPIILVIHQTFSKVNCYIYTKESESVNESSEIIINEDTKEQKLIYSYQNIPNQGLRDRSAIHYGTAKLKLIEKELILKGEYWTDRKTTGDIKLEYWKKEKLDSYTDEIGEHPLSK